jgi:GGDEF domain-containing protein
VVYEPFRAMDMLQVADRLNHEVSRAPVTVIPDVIIAAHGSSSSAADSPERPESGALNIGVTVSTGISWFSRSDSSWEEAVRRSDRALYRAKAEGKNCSRMEPPENYLNDQPDIPWKEIMLTKGGLY